MQYPQIVTLVDFSNIPNAAVMAAALLETRKYFAEFNMTQPPMPTNANSFIPCRLLVTETENEVLSQNRVGRIQFIRENGDVCYDNEWRI